MNLYGVGPGALHMTSTMCTCTDAHTTPHTWGLEDSFREVVLSFHHVEAWEQAPLPIEPSLSAPLDLLRLPKLEFSSPMCSSPLCPLLHLSLSESPLPPALLTETSAYSLPFSKGTVIAQKWYLPFQPTPSYSFCFHKAHYSTLPFLS